jgi:hypothetical protein
MAQADKRNTTSLSRRAALAGAAALPALAMPAIALTTAGPDPIFAAIERHRIAHAAFWSCNDLPDAVDDDVMDACGTDADRALADLLTTRPTTIAGCIAVLRHVDHHLAEYEDVEARLLGNASDPVGSAGKAFLVMIADALGAVDQSG